MNFKQLNPRIEAKMGKKPTKIPNRPFSAEESIYFEPLILEYISHFSRLMEVLQTYQEDKDIV